MDGVCSDVSDGIPLKCCLNYRLVGNSCEECWPGTHGINCMQYCPPNFYGRFCIEVCGCQPCDRVKGCTYSRDEDPTKFPTWLTILTSGFVICLVFSILTICKFRRTVTVRPDIMTINDGKHQMVPPDNRRCRASFTSRTIDLYLTDETETSHIRQCDYETIDPNNMIETTFQNAG